MILYRNSDGSGCPYLIIDYFSLQRIIQVETAKFLKEYPQQFENIQEAKEYAPMRFTMLANRICLQAKETELS